jgi:hypothetical protein
MAKYKYASMANDAVNDTELGIIGIHRGLYRWGDVEEWLALGNSIDPYETPEEQASRLLMAAKIEQDRSEIEAVKSSPQLKALVEMTPVQVGAWVDANVTTLGAAKEVIKTLAMAVCILARRL